MTIRLYYDDAYLARFTARVIEQYSRQDKWAVVLDRTAFYPTSGGQPFDRGILGGQPVLDVLLRETDGEVLHLLESELEPGEVGGEIDWERRFDHMQQHTGQHILSQAFMQVAQAETVSFHLSAESSTIDLAHKGLSPQDMEQAELLANEIIWQDRPIITSVVPSSELEDLPLRKPATVSGDVRVIQVQDFDWSACGGTHVARCGEIGLIKITRWERRGDEMRIEFRCGRRAYNDYGLKHSLVHSLAAEFNVGYWELDQAVERLASEAKDLRSRLRQAERDLCKHEAAELRAAAPNVAGARLVVHTVIARSQGNLRELARHLISQPGVVALLGAIQDPHGAGKVQMCFARSPDVELDLTPLVRGATKSLGGQGGGGRADFCQGGAQLADAQQLESALEWAAQEFATMKDKQQWKQ
jgi:alanyl-tRNA synthetase